MTSKRDAGEPSVAVTLSRDSELKGRLNTLSMEIGEAIREGSTRHQAALRLERAVIEMELRDLWGPWSHEGSRWDLWMQDDVRVARRLADELAEQIGDSGLPRRLLRPYPRLERVVTW